MQVFKIGVWERKVLRYLALNPDQHQKAIQEALAIPNYGMVVNARKALQKKKLVTFKMGKSAKGKPIKLWRLSEDGVGWVLRNETFNEKEAKQLIDNYTENENAKKIFQIFIEELGANKVTQILGACAWFLFAEKKGKINPAIFLAVPWEEKDTVALEKVLARIMELLDEKTKMILKIMLASNKLSKLF